MWERYLERLLEKNPGLRNSGKVKVGVDEFIRAMRLAYDAGWSDHVSHHQAAQDCERLNPAHAETPLSDLFKHFGM